VSITALVDLRILKCYERSPQVWTRDVQILVLEVGPDQYPYLMALTPGVQLFS
jgi:hypothetical protein